MWEADDRERDWSRTWSCKSKKELLQEKRRQHVSDLLKKSLCEAETHFASGKSQNGALKHRDTTTKISNITDIQLDTSNGAQIRVKQKRFKFDPASWSQKSQNSESSLEETSNCDIPSSLECEDSLESSDSSLPPNATVEFDHGSDYWRNSDSEEDGFYLSEEDLPTLNSSISGDFDFFCLSPGFEFESGSRIKIEDGEYVDIEDEKTGFLRVEYGPKVIQLLPTERVLPRGSNQSE